MKSGPPNDAHTAQSNAAVFEMYIDQGETKAITSQLPNYKVPPLKRCGGNTLITGTLNAGMVGVETIVNPNLTHSSFIVEGWTLVMSWSEWR